MDIAIVGILRSISPFLYAEYGFVLISWKVSKIQPIRRSFVEQPIRRSFVEQPIRNWEISCKINERTVMGLNPAGISKRED